MAADRACTVSFTDPRGIKHSVDLTADSLFDAAVLGVHILRSGEWNDPPGQTAMIEVEVRNPSVRHTVSLVQISRWLNGASNSPRESMKKVQLRKLLATGGPPKRTG